MQKPYIVAPLIIRILSICFLSKGFNFGWTCSPHPSPAKISLCRCHQNIRWKSVSCKIWVLYARSFKLCIASGLHGSTFRCHFVSNRRKRRFLPNYTTTFYKKESPTPDSYLTLILFFYFSLLFLSKTLHSCTFFYKQKPYIVALLFVNKKPYIVALSLSAIFLPT